MLTQVAIDEIQFSHNGVTHVAVPTDSKKNGYILHHIFVGEDDTAVGNIFLHPEEDKAGALTVWSAYH